MLTYKITFDIGAKLELVGVLNAKLFPLMNQAVHGVAQATAANWREAVMRARLWSGEKDAYAGSISYSMTGDFSAWVSADYKHAEEIETGRPPRDLKRMLDTSLKVRISKKGARYLIIPFRHGVPGSNTNPMPKAVYLQAKAMEASRITGHGRRMSGTGAWSLATKAPYTVRQRAYSWGDRLGGDAGRRHAGMVRFDASTPGAKRSTFLTFRVMSEKSKGWIIPAQPGKFIARGVADEMQPKASLVFQEAIRRSLT